ncbi:AP-3 complex subunit mu-2 [Chytridiales sp. JEL 0842]|nr:AP-3 complex subunit mu-2 [Chytridiales sp. JEL 0842]
MFSAHLENPVDSNPFHPVPNAVRPLLTLYHHFPSTLSRILIEKHYRSVIPNSRATIDHFWNAVLKSKAGDVPVIQKDVNVTPPLITIPDYYLIHALRGGVYLVAVVSQEVQPLKVVEFLHRTFDLWTSYFGAISEQIVKDNFDIIYELLEELLDYGYPYITEPCILKDMIPPPSLLSTVINAVSLGTNFGTKAPTGTLSHVPWRNAGIKYTNNEVFIDVLEELDIILDKNGNLIAGNIQGEVVCTSKLSGMPDLLLSKLSISVQPRSTGGKNVENVVISFTLPKHISTAKIDSSFGTISFDQTAKHIRWTLPKLSLQGGNPYLTGTLYFETVSSAANGLDEKPVYKKPAIQSLMVVSVEAKVNMYAASGVRIDSLQVHGEAYKPYKGVRMMTTAGKYQIRV